VGWVQKVSCSSGAPPANKVYYHPAPPPPPQVGVKNRPDLGLWVQNAPRAPGCPGICPRSECRGERRLLPGGTAICCAACRDCRGHQLVVGVVTRSCSLSRVPSLRFWPGGQHLVAQRGSCPATPRTRQTTASASLEKADDERFCSCAAQQPLGGPPHSSRAEARPARSARAVTGRSG
jgi:hypothetical protein